MEAVEPRNNETETGCAMATDDAAAAAATVVVAPVTNTIGIGEDTTDVAVPEGPQLQGWLGGGGNDPAPIHPADDEGIHVGVVVVEEAVDHSAIHFRILPSEDDEETRYSGVGSTVDAAAVEEILDTLDDYDNNNFEQRVHQAGNENADNNINIINNNINNVPINTARHAAAVRLHPLPMQQHQQSGDNYNNLPEVEPEVDIEEVDVDADPTNRSTISALTTSLFATTASSTTSSSYGEYGGEEKFDDATINNHSTIIGVIEEEEKEDANIINTNKLGGHAAIPPSTAALQQRQDWQHSYGSSEEGPDYKAQVNSRSVIMAQQQQQCKSVGEEDAIAVVATAAGHIEDDQGDATEYLPDRMANHRLVVVPPLMPSQSPLSSRQASNNTARSSGAGGSHPSQGGSSGSGSGNRRHHSDEEHIPVVDAILVPAERLAAEATQEQRQRQQHPAVQESHPRSVEHGSSSRASTITTTENSNAGHDSDSRNNVNDNDRSRSKSSESAGPPVSERQFWVTVIVAALFLNSLLVAGAVVGGFCAAGKCSGSSGKLIDVSAVGPPSPAPQARFLSEVPSATPTTMGSTNGAQKNNTSYRRPMGSMGSRAPTISPQPTTTRFPSLSPTISTRPTILNVELVYVSPANSFQPTPTAAPTLTNTQNDNLIRRTLAPATPTQLPKLTVSPRPSGTHFPVPQPVGFPVPQPVGITDVVSLQPTKPVPRDPTVHIPIPALTESPTSESLTILPIPNVPTRSPKPSVSQTPFSVEKGVALGTGYPTTGVPVSDTGVVTLKPSLLASLMPSQPPLEPPSQRPVSKVTATTKKQSQRKAPMAVLIPVIAGMELVIMGGLYIYYRRWKRQQKVYADAVAVDRIKEMSDEELFV